MKKNNSMNKKELKYLRNIQLFSLLDEDELEQISSIVSLKTFLKNETILIEEDTNEFMYIILLGRVKVTSMTDEGKETVLAIHNEGDFFGEMSLIDGSTSPATVVATEKSLVAIVSRNNFYSLLYSQRKILEKLLHIFCQRLRESWKKIHILSLKNAHERLKHLFITLSEDHGRETKDGVLLDIKLTHQDIADMAGLTRESVTRVIDRWKREGAISMVNKKKIRLSGDFLKDEFF